MSQLVVSDQSAFKQVRCPSFHLRCNLERGNGWVVRASFFPPRYYLRNLCDEARFPDWPIVEHVEFLQSLLAMWREELTRRPLELSEEQACEILEISKDDVTDTSAAPEKDGAETGGQRRVKRKGRIDEEVLKRQYKKMAMKYHPDKNPEGRDQFMAVQTAYERLQASLAGGLQVRRGSLACWIIFISLIPNGFLFCI